MNAGHPDTIYPFLVSETVRAEGVVSQRAKAKDMDLKATHDMTSYKLARVLAGGSPGGVAMQQLEYEVTDCMGTISVTGLVALVGNMFIPREKEPSARRGRPRRRNDTTRRTS